MTIDSLSSKHNPLLTDAIYGNHSTSYTSNIITSTAAWIPLDKYVLINERIYQIFVFEGSNIKYPNGTIHFKVSDNKYVEVFEDLLILDKEEALDKYPESFL